MNVRQLITILEACDPEDFVVLSKDSEGNGYSPLANVGTFNNYTPDTDWSGDISIRALTPELEALGYTEDDIDDFGDTVPCIVLWPTN